MTKKFYKNYEYGARAPHFIQPEELTDQQWSRLVESKVFCMLPWVHLHAYPDGRAYPCCLSDYWHPVGDLRKNTMAEIWNQDAYKTIRKNMLEDKPCKECTKCYEREETGFFSMRNDSNRNYGQYISEVDKTLNDGTHPEFKIRYWDVRFSNLCNFRCRTCGPIFSSNWYNDHVKLYKNVPDVLNRPMERIEYTTGNEDGMLKQMEEHIPYIEQVYFAGGEPLIMKEHYYLLEKLIEYRKTDVRIQYNTNFSEMRYKDKNVYEYWKHFSNISVGASLDASGARAELLRKGTDWQQIVNNREQMMKETPHVDFYISATVSNMNVLHILDFHKEWTDLNFIKAKDFNVNILQGPDWYRVDVFPDRIKKEIIEPAYNKHLEWLRPQDSLKRATSGFEGVLNFMNSQNKSCYWSQFKNEISKLDNLRKESYWDIFLEMKEFKNETA